MTSNMDPNFFFGDGSAEIDANTVHVRVPKSVSSSTELMQIIARGLAFPEWFGQNWNALYDCLCDFTWLPKRRIIIAHEAVPALPAEQLREYLRVLRDAVDSWRTNPGSHELLVFFPKETELPE